MICGVFVPLGQKIIDDNCSYAHMLLALFHSPGELLQCLQYKAVEITFPAVEQLCAVYKISMPKCLYFITYFNRRLGTWLYAVRRIFYGKEGLTRGDYDYYLLK